MTTSKTIEPLDFSKENFYIGIDVHKKSWYVTVRSSGLEVARFSQPPSSEVLSKAIKQRFPGGAFYSGYEAGFCGTRIHEELCLLGFNNIIIHASDIPTTEKHRKTKADIYDSRAIAANLETGFLKSIYIHSKEQQELRSLFRLRQSKIRDVTKAISRLKGFWMYYSIDIPEDLSKLARVSKKLIAWLEKLELNSDAGKATLKQLCTDLTFQRSQVMVITKQLRQLTENKYPDELKSLLSVPGIGPIVAMALLAEIGDFTRFKNPDQFTSYIGLMPWERSSGETTVKIGIMPHCNHHLRDLLVEASWAAIRNSPSMLQYYKKHAARGNKVAIIKVARKLSLIARSVVLKHTQYDPAYS
ncbi:MAG: IS110-like element ISEc45 family transposase [Ginsengibacter sp.]